MKKIFKYTLITSISLFVAVMGLGLVSIPIIHHLAAENTPQPTENVSSAVPPNVTDIYNLVNEKRVTLGLPALVLDDELMQSAQQKCDATVAANVWAHELPDGRNGLSFIEPLQTNMKYWGENISFGWPDSAGVVNGWMGSKGHRDNILRSNFNHVGYGICTKHELGGVKNMASDYLVVQHFTEE